jgi:hypothetical protein
MARPKKNNADYFSHDVGMRNDIKIKALRRKYGNNGYAAYLIILEILTNEDHFELEWNDMCIELLTSDFDIDFDELKEIIDYCIKLNLLQITNGYIHCDKLTDRLETDVLAKRTGYCRENAKRYVVFVEKTNKNESISQINGQSKVKEIKGKETERNESEVKESKQEESKQEEKAEWDDYVLNGLSN